MCLLDHPQRKGERCGAVFNIKASTNLSNHFNNYHGIYEESEPSAQHADGQSTLGPAFQKEEPYDRDENLAKHYDVARAIVCGLLAFAVVGAAWFRGLAGALNPRYRPTDRGTIRKLILEEAARQRTSLKTALAQGKTRIVGRVHGTSDVWTSVARRAYISFTIHWLDEDFNLHSRCLEVKRFISPHTAVRIKEVIKNFITEWGLQDQIMYLVHDEGSNFKAASRMAEEEAVQGGAPAQFNLEEIEEQEFFADGEADPEDAQPISWSPAPCASLALCPAPPRPAPPRPAPRARPARPAPPRPPRPGPAPPRPAHFLIMIYSQKFKKELLSNFDAKIGGTYRTEDFLASAFDPRFKSLGFLTFTGTDATSLRNGIIAMRNEHIRLEYERQCAEAQKKLEEAAAKAAAAAAAAAAGAALSRSFLQ
eukprot:tig00000139_g8313.t1